ncbi:aspartate carbamoyltransferase catalytic subunit [Corynebacterium felinum]|uniref:Aspartate carbamoyltransferase n=1 Tax=Corynebacterium felinum TaxID=131318 RepID=A0ABU2BEF4_9CORY|nr:aspartate carbamoyltransferase catalytic subunit [Corynebacterium felinum]MDF5821948.1 aspartate carbamoyltransferase catalytic subunit [Corynebacterium felinum]MDR7355759.1 aspartate carbamoyltransferase catalytic subunit [Corynebacterium felinum]WJY95105.1 Aspartate carbamoyltransferase [Corynebacterium felinum]
MKHLLSISDLTADEIVGLMDEADRFREALEGRELKKLPTLRGRTIFTVFYENSTRTRSSFETAGKWMSADVINISASSSSVKKGESLKDTGLTLSAIGADALIIRHPSSGAAQQLAQWVAPGGVGPSVINAGDGSHQHPTQALLDAVTMRQRLGGIDGRKIVIVGDCLHSRVVRSNVDLLSTLGAEVVLVAPPTLLPAGVENWPVRISYDMDAEIYDADAVMMLRVQQERMHGGFFPSHREYATLYGMSKERAAKLQDHAIVMHPGPMLRGMEINFAVADAPHTAVLQQVNNGVHSRMAVLFTLISGAETPGF